MMKPYYW